MEKQLICHDRKHWNRSLFRMCWTKFPVSSYYELEPLHSGMKWRLDFKHGNFREMFSVVQCTCRFSLKNDVLHAINGNKIIGTNFRKKLCSSLPFGSLVDLKETQIRTHSKSHVKLSWIQIEQISICRLYPYNCNSELCKDKDYWDRNSRKRLSNETNSKFYLVAKSTLLLTIVVSIYLWLQNQIFYVFSENAFGI